MMKGGGITRNWALGKNGKGALRPLAACAAANVHGQHQPYSFLSDLSGR